MRIQDRANPGSRRVARALAGAMVTAGCILALLSSGAATGAGDQKQEKGMSNEVVREQYEWSNIWWDCANDPKLPRVLLIGDSISVGYGPVVTRLLQGKYHVDRLSTSRSINDPVLLKETKMMLDEYSYAAVHFNNGLHGFHLEGKGYASALRKYVSQLKKWGRGAKLIWGASTPITKGNDVNTLEAKNAAVVSRNTLAAEVMKENYIPINDLYQLVVGKSDLRSPDGYHYNAGGYELMGKAVAEALLKAIEAGGP